MSLSTRYIREYLELNKTVTLEKIGTLTLPDAISKDEDGNIISSPAFVYDKKAVTTPEFVDYLAEATQKSHSIASADLEYFLDQTRQLMNIGSTPFVIDGIGFIYADKSGGYQLSTEKLEETKEREKKHYEDNYSNSPLTSATNYATRKVNKKVIGRWVLILLIIGVIIFGAYYIPKSSFNFFKDSPADTAAVADTLTKPKVNVPVQPEKPVRKEGSYHFIFQTYPTKAQADKRIDQLKSYGNVVSMDSSSSATGTLYRLYIAMDNVQATDTVRLKDSLKSYYGHAVTIE
ncbi:hypothetical protein SAMN05192529_11863 [Arachidicoccus rhizosphaerae]|uniref:Uncharacterized protein n=1 Tax=Arachidicoccus rhizosphaerae TaxID=551991 RepID=A0A1H4B5G7_9BACT|nr:hypothetical protein [Arachidicoccus rhizosphaerae]SEA43433.1 hypothetical protein SAMN05192529_11863 [Arachidicoccus rhizosphaerae]